MTGLTFNAYCDRCNSFMGVIFFVNKDLAIPEFKTRCAACAAQWKAELETARSRGLVFQEGDVLK